jgi:hypothetical protein
MGEPLGDGATRRAVGGKTIYGSGGGGGSAEKQTTIVDLPEWAKPYAKESLGKAAALTSSPYQTYGGERTAQFSPLQKQAFDAAAQQKVADQIGAGSGLAGTAGLAGLTGGYQPGQFGSQMGQYMSPYMDAVVQRQMESAQRQADIAGTQRGAQAVRAGAFGGSRQAVENAEAARALASQKGEIQAQGLQSAYDRATDMYGREQALAEQSRQAGLSTALGAAGQLGQLGQQQFGQQMGITDLQQQLGGQQRAATQDILSTQYQDFLNQQRAPFDQLSFMSSIIRGTPMGQTTTQYQPPASPTSQLLGLGIAGAGAYGAYQGAQNRAEGGEVKGYAAGGIADLNQPEMAAMAGRMSDQQLQRTRGIPSITEIAELTLDNEAKQRALRRQLTDGQEAMMAQKPQSTVAEERMAAIDAMDQGLGGLDVPDDMIADEGMAGGGIVAFQNRGAVPEPEAATSPAGNFFRGIGNIVRVDPKLASLRDRQAAAQQGIFEALTPTEKRARAEELRIVEQEIATLQSGRATPAPAASDIAAGVDGSDSRFQRGPSVAGITNQPAAAPTAGAAPTGTQTAGRSAGAASAGAANTGIAALMPKSIQDLQAQRRTEVEAAGKAGEKIESDLLAATKRDRDEMGPPGVEREKRQKAQEKALEGAEGKNFNMALIEAGLAIMAGNSANAFENIGKGAMIGTKAYTTGMERIQSRKEKLDESIAALDELRYSTAKVDKKELREREAAVNKAKQQTATALAAVTGEEAKVAVDMYTNQLNRQATLAAASMRASGGGSGTSKAVKDAEAAYAKDPAALAIKKQLELPYIANNRTKRETAENQLRLIRADKYRQFGATLETDTAGATGSDSDILGIR